MKTATTTILQDLVVNTLNPSAKVLSPAEIKKWLTELPEISREMFQVMGILVFSPLEANLVNRHIRQIQRETIFLIDTLQAYQNIPACMAMLHQAVLTCLTELLQGIEEQYSDYFNLDLAMPASGFKAEVEKLSNHMDLLIAGLKAKSSDKALQQLIIGSLNGFLTADSCTYYRLAYVQGLQESLTNLCKTTEKKEADERLREHLVYYNLNNATHVRYHKTLIANALASVFDVQEQYELLYAYQKQFRGWQQLKTAAYSPRQEGIRQVMLSYIKAEIKYLTKVRPVSAPDPASDAAVSNYKICVSLSVDALAYFFRLLILAGVVNGSPRSQLIRFIAKHFQTPGASKKGISERSLEGKYNQVVQSTANTVRMVLMRMLKILNDQFITT
ncbi:hypothetical protein [Pedobacter sp. MC2016-24]|uniref:hypothetical protein n=1 Tax=Pedobacter sp. MC2016-24 TaxID=2780090 RepID=UPI00187E06C7|nr:hypothetical protein [Pedobacter sp. MC2016-24]MBE9601872.1 hypothetical protein [Pedobacter sp. MC2016-24]